MTTFDALESSQQASQPVELYRFALGGDPPFLYTSSEDAITIPSTGDVYQPLEGLERTPIRKGQDARNQPLEVLMPADNVFASTWKVRPPGVRGTLTIFRVQRAETPSIGTTMAMQYKGIIDSVDFPKEGKIASVAVGSIESAGRTAVPRMGFKPLCNHFLYDARCKVNPNLHKVSATVSAEDNSNNTITVPGCGAFADQTFRAGYVKPTAVEDFRLIVSQVGDVLTLNLPFKQPVLGTLVDAFKGCDREIDGDCLTIFNNVIEFGGWPFVPTRDIFKSGLL